MLFTEYFSKLSFPLTGLVRLPEVSIPEATSGNKEFFKRMVWDGYRAKRAAGKFEGIVEQTVIERLTLEFEVFDKTGIIDYLLLVWDILKWCDDQNIPRGPGRGSVAGSLAAYCSSITKINPLKHNLNFTRFISEARAKPQIIDGILYASGKSLCDIDCDISFSQRDRVLDYIHAKYPGRVAKIANRLELTGKTALKDVLKIYLGQSEVDARAISNHIEAIFGKVESLGDAIVKHKDLRKWVESSPPHQEAVVLAKKIEGTYFSKGVHASGVYISFHPLDGNMPIELSKHKETITSYDMNTVAEMGVKFDALGLKTLDTISETCKLVGIEMDDIDINHPSIYKYLSSTERFYGLFQIESGLTKEVIKRVSPRHIDDLASCLSISRPGALSGIDQFVKYVKTGEMKKVYPDIDALLAATGGLILYQESINEICQKVYRMKATDADEVRRAIGKKIRADMAKWEPVLYANGEKYGIPKDITKYFWDTCNASADYLFSANHCYAYAYITAQTIYLKANYPTQFLLSLFRMAKHEQDSQDCLAQIMLEASEMGVKVLAPDLIKSNYDFDLDADGNIRFGLSHIRGISDVTVAKLASFKRDFSTKFQIFEAAAAAKINIGVLVSLIYAGCIDTKGINRSKLALEAQLYNLLTDREKPLIHHLATEYKEDLIAMMKDLPNKLNEKGKPLIKQSRLVTLRKDYVDYWGMYKKNSENEELCSYMWERHLLGFSYSGTIHSVFSRKIVDLISVKDIYAKTEALREYKEQNHGELPKPELLKFVGFVDEIKQFVSKGNKTPYIKAKIRDDYGTIILMIYGKDKIDGIFAYHARLPEEGDLVIVNGFMSKEGGMIWADTVIIQRSPIALKKSMLEETTIV